MGSLKSLPGRDSWSAQRSTPGAGVEMEVLEPRLLLAADWTLLVYLDADNDLEDAGIDDVNEMEVVGSTSDVNILVQFDRIPDYDTSNGNWTDTRRGRVVQDSNPTSISTTFASIGEQNMGDATVLRGYDYVRICGVSVWNADGFMLDEV